MKIEIGCQIISNRNYLTTTGLRYLISLNYLLNTIEVIILQNFDEIWNLIFRKNYGHCFQIECSTLLLFYQK